MKREEALMCLTKVRERISELREELRIQSRGDDILIDLSTSPSSDSSILLGNLTLIRHRLVAISYGGYSEYITNPEDIALIHSIQRELGIEPNNFTQQEQTIEPDNEAAVYFNPIASLYQFVIGSLNNIGIFFSYSHAILTDGLANVAHTITTHAAVPPAPHNHDAELEEEIADLNNNHHQELPLILENENSANRTKSTTPYSIRPNDEGLIIGKILHDIDDSM